MKTHKFSEMLGLTLASASGKVGDDEVVFTSADGSRFRLYHQQDCCESVTVEDICGDWSDIIGSPLIQSEESTSHDPSLGSKQRESGDSFTWTFYRMATKNGQVVIRWFGESNGYYSESVDFEKVSER